VVLEERGVLGSSGRVIRIERYAQVGSVFISSRHGGSVERSFGVGSRKTERMW
jgi:hypothetical protein